MTGDWAASAFRWWMDAGVDVIVGEEPRNWLSAGRPAETTHPRHNGHAAGVPDAPAFAPSETGRAETEPTETCPPETWPDNLEAFRDWWLTTRSLPGAAPSAPRVGPSGSQGASLMVLVDMPAMRDFAAGHLLSGEAGALFDRMLAAIRLDRSAIYLASLSPLRMPSGRFGPATLAGLAELARHHVGLVRPRALLLFGDACSHALLGAPVAATHGRWHELETPGGPVRAVSVTRPEKLLVQPALKRMAWENLQMVEQELAS